MPNCFLGLGSNLGDRLALLKSAEELISKRCGNVVQKSSVYETDPWGDVPQPLYLNQVIQIHTHLTVNEVLKVCLDIEKFLGRTRNVRWDSRTLDVDLLFYDDCILNESETLIVPHPRMHLRNFVLQPMVEIAPDFVHPVLKKSMHELLNASADALAVKLFQH